MSIFQDLSVSLIGYGVSNRALCAYLLKNGVCPTVRTPEREEMPKCVTNICGKDYLYACEDIVFRSPSVRPDKIKTNGIIKTEIGFSLENACGVKIGITGSDGKTTTSTIIYELLSEQGKDAILCGNIGTPLVSQLDRVKKDTYTVAELSSFQLMDASLCLDVAIITGITENHLDWHTDFHEYTEAKLNIIANASKIVLDYDNEILRGKIERVPQNAYLVLTSLGEKIDFKRENTSYVTVKNGSVYYDEAELLPTEKIKLRGNHNIKNYQSAIGALYPIISKKTAENVAERFSGAPHRCELALAKNGVNFYDSSIDTTPSRTIATLGAFDKKHVILLLGGYDKCLDYMPLSSALNGVYACVICGENSHKIYEAIKNTETKIFLENTFFDAVKRAFSLARTGDSVLLSPSSASFDMFKSYRERAEKFKDIIKEL